MPKLVYSIYFNNPTLNFSQKEFITNPATT